MYENYIDKGVSFADKMKSPRKIKTNTTNTTNLNTNDQPKLYKTLQDQMTKLIRIIDTQSERVDALFDILKHLTNE